MKTIASALVAAVATAFLLGAQGASDARRANPRPAPPACLEQLPAATGSFDSNWGPLQLVHSGDRITGRYQCCGGGTIEGRVTGNVIRYTWKQPGASGRGVWVIASTGELIGSWGTTDEVSGGAWNLTRAPAAIADP